MRNTTLHISAVILLTLAAYAPVYDAGFVHDDQLVVAGNPVLTKRGVTLRELWEYWPTRFLVTLSFYLNYRLGRLDPAGFHLANVGLHAANAVCLYFVLRRALSAGRGRRPPDADSAAFLGALVFALHPLQTQGVSYVSQRSVIMATLFYFLTWLMYFRGGQWKGWYAFAWASSAAAMLCKEMAVTLPFSLILGDALAAKGKSGLPWRRWLLFFAVSLLVPLLVLLNAHNPIYNDSGQVSILTGRLPEEEQWCNLPVLPRGAYAVTQLRVIVTYLRLALLPVRQNFDYSFPYFFSFFNPAVIFSTLVISSVLILGIILGKEKKYGGGFGIFFFFLALIPESSAIPIRDVIAEHRLYLPLAGLAFLAAEGVRSSLRLRRLGGVAVLLLMALTINRNRVWKTPLALWEDALRKSPGQARCHSSLGLALAERGDLNGAIARYREALRICPDLLEARSNLANALAEQGRIEEAIRHYSALVASMPHDASVRYNLGVALQKAGRLEEAAGHYSEAIRLAPGHGKAYLNLALIRRDQDRIEEAISTLRRALEVDPEYVNAHYNLAVMLLERNRADEARTHLETALRLEPGHEPARRALSALK